MKILPYDSKIDLNYKYIQQNWIFLRFLAMKMRFFMTKIQKFFDRLRLEFKSQI
jgi:hypothetical protein